MIVVCGYSQYTTLMSFRTGFQKIMENKCLPASAAALITFFNRHHGRELVHRRSAGSDVKSQKKDIFSLLQVGTKKKFVVDAEASAATPLPNCYPHDLLKLPVLDKGFVRLVDCMPRLIPVDATGGDGSIASAARVSYEGVLKKKTAEDDRKLIRYLLRHKHTSPFEMAEMTFHVKAPVFVARQWFRHRTASVNEWSARYSNMPAEYYEPTLLRKQSEANKQTSEDSTTATVFVDDEAAHGEYAAAVHRTREAHAAYERLTNEHKVAREQARIGLPVAMYTQFYWKCDLHNFMNFLRLRLAADAQPEIQVYAKAMMRLAYPLFPVTFEAFDDYILSAVTFSRVELDALRAFFLTHLKPFNGEEFNGRNEEYFKYFAGAARERDEFVKKRNRIFLAPRFWNNDV